MLGIVCSIVSLKGLLFGDVLLGRILFNNGSWVLATHAGVVTELTYVVTTAAPCILSGYVTCRIAEKNIQENLTFACILNVLIELYLIHVHPLFGYNVFWWNFYFIAIAISSTLCGAYIAQKKPRELAYYTPAQIAFVPLVGGPLAGCWLMRHNSQLLRKRTKTPGAMIYGAMFCVIVFILIEFFGAPPSNFLYLPVILFPIVFYFLAKDQKKKLTEIIATGIKKQTYLWTAAIGFIFLSLTLSLFLGVDMILHSLQLPLYDSSCHTLLCAR